ncbi:hypothetical protein DUNSADRAFT_4814 [Dunaliella salina]|uniref:Secreted protein n=1 Tax=Dunaliella salina TaxID=3046 RepID=A0ABQ7GRE1_DUNSA|nr:hypothetical protein DUNSADRAFT_4814 [Dunaliella salina]|eukprot:KAF5837137.1 hypothetical protein DUNSADRAFT_4814 [Dunaliella salina]
MSLQAAAAAAAALQLCLSPATLPRLPSTMSTPRHLSALPTFAHFRVSNLLFSWYMLSGTGQQQRKWWYHPAPAARACILVAAPFHRASTSVVTRTVRAATSFSGLLHSVPPLIRPSHHHHETLCI